MFRFPLTDCDFSIIRALGQVQTLPGAHAMPEMTDPHERNKTRGNGDLSGTGIVYDTGFGQTKEQVFQFKTTSMMGGFLRDLWSSKEEFDFSIVNRKTGDKRLLKKAILAKEPMQMAIEEGEESTITSITMRFFEVEDKINE
jgi:hypothetical protein